MAYVVVSGFSTQEEVERIAERLLYSISEPHNAAGQKLTVTPSIGISLYPQDGSVPDELIGPCIK